MINVGKPKPSPPNKFGRSGEPEERRPLIRLLKATLRKGVRPLFGDPFSANAGQSTLPPADRLHHSTPLAPYRLGNTPF